MPHDAWHRAEHISQEAGAAVPRVAWHRAERMWLHLT